MPEVRPLDGRRAVATRGAPGRGTCDWASRGRRRGRPRLLHGWAAFRRRWGLWSGKEGVTENWVSVQEGRLRRFGLSRGNTDASFAEWGFLSENRLSGTLACFIFRFAPRCEKLWLNEAWLTNQSFYFGSVGTALVWGRVRFLFFVQQNSRLCSQFPTRRQREGARNRDGLDEGFLRRAGQYNGEPGI